MQSDAELVNACLNGEKEAFSILIRRYQRPVRAVALDVVRDYHLAADVSQNAFVAAYRNLPALRKAEAFGPWLMKITRRCALDLLQRKSRESPLEAASACGIESPDGQLDEDKQRLLAAVLQLPEAEKQVVMLRYFSAQNVKDVADTIGRSVGTVTKQLSRAHKRLRKMLPEMEAKQ